MNNVFLVLWDIIRRIKRTDRVLDVTVPKAGHLVKGLNGAPVSNMKPHFYILSVIYVELLLS